MALPKLDQAGETWARRKYPAATEREIVLMRRAYAAGVRAERARMRRERTS